MFDEWLSKTQRIRKVNCDEKSSTHIYRHRFLNKYLSIWLQKLHITLKKKHLEKIKNEFEKHSGLRKEYFQKWIY